MTKEILLLIATGKLLCNSSLAIVSSSIWFTAKLPTNCVSTVGVEKLKTVSRSYQQLQEGNDSFWYWEHEGEEESIFILPVLNDSTYINFWVSRHALSYWKPTGAPYLSLTTTNALYREPIPGGTLLTSSSESSHGAGPSPTNLQYPSCRASACSSVAFCTRDSRRKLMPKAPKNCDWVIGPYTAAPTVTDKLRLLSYLQKCWHT